MTGAQYNVVLGEHAAADIEAAADWYAEHHPAGLDRFLSDFTKVRDMLSIFPTAGRERPEFQEDLRSLPVHPYVAFSTVDDKRKRVTIVRVLHGHLDIGSADF